MSASEVLRRDNSTKSSSDTYLGIVVHGRCRDGLVLTRSALGAGNILAVDRLRYARYVPTRAWVWTSTSHLIHFWVKLGKLERFLFENNLDIELLLLYFNFATSLSSNEQTQWYHMLSFPVPMASKNKPQSSSHQIHRFKIPLYKPSPSFQLQQLLRR